MLFRRLILILLTVVMPCRAADHDFELTAPSSKPARLAVVAYDPQGVVVTVPNANVDSSIYYNPTLNGGAVGAVMIVAAEAIADAIQVSRRNRALGPEWKAMDQDELGERLQKILQQHIDQRNLAEGAKIKDMKFFGLSKAGFLQRYTPGTVVVYEAWMGFTPDLDQLTFAVTESLWDFKFRAKSRRELRRIPKDQVQAHRPVITVLNSHLYTFSPTLVSEDLPEKLRKKARFKQYGYVWRTDGSKLLKEQLEAGFDHIEASMAEALIK